MTTAVLPEEAVGLLIGTDGSPRRRRTGTHTSTRAPGCERDIALAGAGEIDHAVGVARDAQRQWTARA